MNQRRSIPIRTASAADADAIARLINRAYLVERFFVAGDRTSGEEVLALLGRGTFLVSEAPAVTGCVYVEPHGASAYLGLLAVDPDRQGAGLGSHLLEAAESHCAAAGSTAIDIKVVNLRTELHSFYRRRGYDEQGTEPFESPRVLRPCEFILMRKLLPR